MTWQDDMDAKYDMWIDELQDTALEYGRIGLTCKSNLYYDVLNYWNDWYTP